MDASEQQYRPEPGIAVPVTVGERPSSRGAARRGWSIVQTHAGDPADLAARIREDLEGGADGIRLDVSSLTADALATALAGLPLDGVLELGNGDEHTAAALLRVASERGIEPRVDFGLDPVGRLARAGRITGSLESRVEASADLAGRLAAGSRAFTVDDGVWHDAGADEATCIGLQAATGLAYVRAMEGRGMALDDAFGQVAFRSAMSGRFLLGIAKLRAARRVWTRIAAACGVEATPFQTAVTCHRERTVRDPWVNILRGTTGAFAGIVGGADRVDVPPFAGGDEARRLARNTALVLRDEAHLGRVADPAGGSLAVEALTEALANAAWSTFQGIEAQGGIAAALRSGAVQAGIAKSRARLEDRVRHRKDAVLGVSRYPNLDEERLAPLHETGAQGSGPGETVEPLRPWRRAAAFEALRERAEAPVLLATLGPLAEHSARTGFGRELVEAGGLRAVVPDDVQTPEQAVEALGSARVAVISCADKRFATDAVDAAKRLTAAGAAVWMLGRPGEHEAALRAAGVRDFLFLGGDALATLDALWAEVQR
ncbi:MAG: methylmalonyl-CoA mutase [Alphaproteobacteria bacterium]|nr:methylmalonyl-CoA mutase [Alphaproteobacteria bacterium]